MSGSAASLKTKVHRVKLRDLKLLEKNARFMKEAQYRQLVDNLKRDGALTSAPTVYKGEVLSGNHRVMAAIEAGIEEADVIEIVSTLTKAQRVAIQLSHNSIVGEDDPNVLLDLYSHLDLSFKTYSGLTDDYFKGLDELDTSGLAVGSPGYEELIFLFLPEERDVFEKLLEKVEKVKKKPRRLVAHYKDFEAIFDAVIAVKTKHNIHNAAVALRMMAELAVERLEQLDKDGG